MNEQICRIVWVFDRDHTKHPFLGQSLDTLTRHGCMVTIVDTHGEVAGASYRAFPDFDYSKKLENWHRIKIDRSRELKAKQQCYRLRIKVIDRDRRHGKIRRTSWRNVRATIERTWFKVRQGWLHLLREIIIFVAQVRSETIDSWNPYQKAFRRLWAIDCDVVVGTRPAAALIGYVVARLRRKRFVYYPFELYGFQAAPHSAVIAWLEQAMLRSGVSALITQNEPRAEVYRERGARIPPVVVHNYKLHRTVERTNRLRETLGLGPDRRIVLYEGVLSAGRWLDRLAQASLLLPPDTVLVMMGEQKSWWPKNAPAFVDGPQSAGRLLVARHVPHEELLDYVADADVGVIIYDDSVLNNYLCEPGKLSDYVLAKVPIVAPNFPTIEPVIAEYGVGVCFDGSSPEAIAAAIVRVLEPGRSHWLPALEKAGRRLIWSTQALDLVAAVTGVPQLTSVETEASDIVVGAGEDTHGGRV